MTKTFNYVSGLPELKSLKTEQLDGKRFYVTPTGNKVPSVTTVLGHFKKQALLEWRARVGNEEANKISAKASGYGTRFHNIMEKYLKNETLLTENIMPDMKICFNKLKSFVDKSIDNIHYIESPLYSDKMKMAGRTDLIAEINGELAVIDFKTSAKEKKEEHIQDYFQQGTAYCLMYEEILGTPINKIGILISVNDVGVEPQIFIKNKKDYIDPLVQKVKQYHKEFQ